MSDLFSEICHTLSVENPDQTVLQLAEKFFCTEFDIRHATSFEQRSWARAGFPNTPDTERFGTH